RRVDVQLEAVFTRRVDVVGVDLDLIAQRRRRGSRSDDPAPHGQETECAAIHYRPWQTRAMRAKRDRTDFRSAHPIASSKNGPPRGDPKTLGGGGPRTLIEFLELLLHDLGLQRNEHVFVGDHLLSFLAEHELEELL